MTLWSDNPQGQGVLVAADERAEWLLPWWWSRYTCHNSYPVCFIDFGMSRFGKSFCETKGEIIPFDITIPSSINQCEDWEAIYGKTLWQSRTSWLKKPFAMMRTPFERTLWLDLDCEILTSLSPLFDLKGGFCIAHETPGAIRLEKERKIIYEDEELYNSGVIVYKHGSPIFPAWAKKILEQTDIFWGDQNALARVIYEQKFPVEVIDEAFNWRMSSCGFHLRAAIVHWVGPWGKEYIRTYGGVKDALHFLYVTN